MDSDIQKFNQNYIDNLGNNLEFYLHYLSTMAKFHKYSAEDLAGLSVYAPQNFSAVASPDVWKKHFHRSISKNARGIDIFRDGKKITVYDVSETVPPDKISLWEYNDDLHKKFLHSVVQGDFSTPEKIQKIAENLISQTDLSDDDKKFAEISTSIVILERLNQSQHYSAEFRRNIESLRRQLINLNFDGRNYKILTDIIQKNSQKILDAFQKSVQSFSSDIMDLENNFTDLSLPENNPLLQTLGVIEVPEKNNQNIVAPAFIEEKFSSDNHVTVLVGENFPDSWIDGNNDKRREDFIKPLENLAIPLRGDWYNENEFDVRDGFRYWRFFFDSRDNAEKFITQTNSFLNEKFSDFQNVSADTSDKKIEPEIQKNSAQDIAFTLNNFSVGQQNLFGDFPENQLTPDELLKSSKLFSDDARDKFRAEFFGHYINLSRSQSYYEERQGNFKVSIPPSSSNKKLLNQLTKLAEKIDGSVDTSDNLYPVFYFKNLDNARTFAKSLEFLFDNATSKVDEDLRTSAEISHDQAEFEKQVKSEQQEKQNALNQLGDEKFSFDDIPDGAGFETDDGIFTYNKNHGSFYNIDAHYFPEMDGILDRALTRMWRFGDVNKAVEAIDYELKFDKIVWRDEQQANDVKNFIKNNAGSWTLVFDVYDDGSEILRGADAEKAIREKIALSKNSVADSEFVEDFSGNNQSDIQTQSSENISLEDLLKDATIEPVIYSSLDTGEIYHTHYPDGFSVEYSTFNIRDGYHGNGNSSGYEYSSKSFRDAFQYVQNHKNDTDKFFLGNDDVVAHYKIIKNNPHPLALGETLLDFNFSTKQETFFDEKIKDFVKDIVPEKISEVTKKTPYEIAFDTFELIKQKYNNHEISIDQAVSDADFALQQFKNSSMILDSRKVDTLQSFVDSLLDEQKEIQKNSDDTLEINFDKKIFDEANSPDSNLEHFSNYFSSMEKVLKRYNQGDISIDQAVYDSKIIVENWKNSLIIADTELNNTRLKILQTFSQYFIDKQNNISQNVSDADTADTKFFEIVTPNGDNYFYSATSNLDLAIHSGAIVDERNHILAKCSDDETAEKIIADIQNAFNNGESSFEISLPENISEQNKSKYLLRRLGRYGDVSNFFYEDFETAMRSAKNDIDNGSFVNVQIFNDSNEICFEWNIGDKKITEKFEVGTFTHSKTGESIPSVKLTEKVDRDTYLKLNSLAKNHGGSYSKFAKQFLFKTSDERDAFITDSAKIFETSQPEIFSDFADENSTPVESLDDAVVQKNISPAESQTDNPFDKMVDYTNDFNQSFYDNFKFVTDDNDSVIDIIDKKTGESAVTESDNEKIDDPENLVIDVPSEKISQNDDEKTFQQILTEDAAQIRGNSLEKNIFRKNLLAIRTLKRLESEDRLPNADEFKILQDFSGFGSIPHAFDKDNPDWYREAWLLHSALTDDEYNSLRASSLNAYYTPSEVVNSIFNALEKMGFESGNILEPSVGVGNFFKHMPVDMKKSSHLFGVELDSITSRIAQKIFPDAEISEQGFETTTYLNNSFDVAIGNVPFGDYRINDKQYGSPLIHDFFIAKMLDQVRAGGLVAVVTHKGTMDKLDNSARKLFARKADLVRAFRLPNNTFKDSKTSVTTDLLIFKKLDKERDTFDELPNWVFTANFNDDDDISINRYFLDNPDDVIGTLEKVSSPYGFDFACKPSENLPLADTLKNLTDSLQKNYIAVENLPTPKQIDSVNNIQPLSFFVEDNEFKFFDGEKTEVVKIPSSDRELILQAINLRNAVRNILNIQLENGTDSELSFAQDNLKFAYDHFVKKFGRIQLNSKLKKLFKKDSSYYLLCSLENFDKDKNFVGVSEIFSERTITIHEKPTHADNSVEALMISMQEHGKVSIPYISSLTDKSEQEIISELEFDRIYFDFMKQEYQIAEEFLSGDIRQKIEDLKDKLFAIDYEFSSDISKKILNFHDDITHYEPKNDIEREILNTENYRYFDFSQNPELEKYILDNQKNYPLLVHVAAIQGSFADSDSEISKLISRHPLAILDAVQHLNKPIFEYSNDYASRFIHRYLDFMQETDILDENNSNYDEHKNLVFAFLRERLTPFEKNPEFLDKISFIDGSPQKIREDVSIDDKNYIFSGIENGFDKIYRPEVEADWNNFQEKFLQNKKNAIENFDFAHSEKFQNFTDTKLRIKKNLEALEQVKPKDLTAADIHVELGATWIPTSDIKQFLCDTLAIQHSHNLNVNFAPITGAWEIEGKKYSFGPKSDITFGVENYLNALVLAENALNGRQSKIYKTVYVDGKETKQIDNEKTIVAQQKTELIKQAFQNWIFNDEERKNRLVAYYNRHFNNIKPREFDGSHLTFPGMSSKIKLRDHQKNAIAHTLYGGNTLFAHCVGAGKTFEMAASAMEAKRLGLCSKSMIVVPKHLTEQTGTEFLQLYPNAKILVATDKDFESDKRKEFCSRIATQNWDAVILGFTQFEKIPISKERQERLLKKQVLDLVAAIEEMKLIKSEHFSVKQAELMKKKLEARLEKLQADNTDQTVTFEQLGVDRLFVDEAHYYKNLFTYTKMSNVAGVSTTDAQKTSDLFNKCQYMNENGNDKCSIVFSTATPLSNSMTELFTMQRYLQPETLKHAGFETFDSWASTFGKVETALELAPEGKGFRYKTRFSSFNNLPELMNMFKEIADIKTSDQLNLEVPHAEFIVEKLQPSDEQKDFVEFLAKRAEDVHNRRVQPEDDNMLKITNDGRKLALDQRLIDPDLPDDENSKVNRCVNNVFQIYSETSDKKSAQLIFCDQSTPSDNFNVYDDFKQKLIEKGVPENEIAFIHDAKNETQKDALFDKVRKGDVRVLLGSTSMMGTGTNVQDKLIALHDLDVPWRPSDLEQRSGRIIRQGNENKNVKIFRYVTEGTFDAYLWGILENKQRFISQIMTSKTPVRSADDVDEATLSYTEIKAIASGNPLIKEKIDISVKLERLRAAKAEFLKSHEHLETKINITYPKLICDKLEQLEKIRADIVTIQNHSSDKFSIVLNEKTFTDKKDAAKFISDILKNNHNSLRSLHGEYNGLKFYVAMNHSVMREEIVLGGKFQSKNFTSAVAGDNINRIVKLAENLPSIAESEQKNIEAIQQQIEAAKTELDIPFPQQDEFEKLKLREAEISAQLNLDSEKQPDIDEEKERRLNNIFSLEPKTNCEKKFFALFKYAVDHNHGNFSMRSQKIAAKKLLEAGFSKNEILETLFKHSPVISDKDELKNILRSIHVHSSTK